MLQEFFVHFLKIVKKQDALKLLFVQKFICNIEENPFEKGSPNGSLSPLSFGHLPALRGVILKLLS